MTWTTRPRSDAGGLAAIRCGDGPPVLLLHGVGLRAEAWSRQIDALSTHHRVTAPDMPGHGESPAPAAPLSLAEYTDRIAATLHDPAIVVGHSMGAMIALDLAARYPDRTRAVAALNAVFERPPEAASAVKARAARLDGHTNPDPAPTLHRWFGNETSPERSACHDWLTTVNPQGYRMADTAFAQATTPTRDRLKNLTCPALFMTGAEEPNSTPEMSETMAALAPQGRARIVEGAAHMMPMTHADTVSAALLSFAREVQS